jgi:hypothetical protein
MGEPFKPREHDHLVEPIFQALQDGGREAKAPRPSRRGWLLFLGLSVVALAICCVLLLWS